MNSDGIQETELCSNCKRDIPTTNYVIHTIHCQRNIILCSMCNEPVHRDEVEEHALSQHAPVFCKGCNKQFEKCKLDLHVTQDCPNRRLKCQICDIDVAAHELAEHENYCGARTEKCADCGDFVMLQYKQLHLDSNHTFTNLCHESEMWRRDPVTLGSFFPGLQASSLTGRQTTHVKRQLGEDPEESRDEDGLPHLPARRPLNGVTRRTTGTAGSGFYSKKCDRAAERAATAMNFNKPANERKRSVKIPPRKSQSPEDIVDLDRLLALELTELEADALDKKNKDHDAAVNLSRELNRTYESPRNSRSSSPTASDHVLAISLSEQLNVLSTSPVPEEDQHLSDRMLAMTLSDELNAPDPPPNLLSLGLQALMTNTPDYFTSLHKDEDLRLTNMAVGDTNKTKDTIKKSVGSFSDDSDDDLLSYNDIRPRDAITLPCEFCGANVLCDELMVHQDGCKPRERRPYPPWMSDIVEIPCEFCEEVFPTFRLNSHQLLCNKNWSRPGQLRNNIDPVTTGRMKKKENMKRTDSNEMKKSMRDLKHMNSRQQAGLQNGIEPTSPRFNRLGTRTELLQDQRASKPKTKSKKTQRAPSPPSPDM